MNHLGEKDGYVLRLARKADAEAYFHENFDPLDPEVARLTGCKPQFSHEEVIRFFDSCIEDKNRYDFLLIDPEGRIIGESVINEIDWDLRSANFRVAIFHSVLCGKGIGAWVIGLTRDFAFSELKLHRLSLDVFSFNERAQKAYLKAGFQTEGVLRDAVRDGDSYADDVLMSILEDDWRRLHT